MAREARGCGCDRGDGGRAAEPLAGAQPGAARDGEARGYAGGARGDRPADEEPEARGVGVRDRDRGARDRGRCEDDLDAERGERAGLLWGDGLGGVEGGGGAARGIGLMGAAGCGGVEVCAPRPLARAFGARL